MYLIRTALAALVAATLVATTAAAAQEPAAAATPAARPSLAGPIPNDPGWCQSPEPPPFCDGAPQTAPLPPCSSGLPGSGGYLFQGIGAGQRNSAPLALAGGAYLATWDATDTTALSYIDLEPADDRNGLRSYSILGPSGDAASRSGQSYVYNVKPGSYYVSAKVTGPWSVRLTPIAT